MYRSILFSLLFAFVPGAGEMYMGLMNRGLSVMIAFWGIIGFCTFSRLEFFLFLCPVIWFYSFFETLNLRKMTQEQLAAIPDTMVLGIDSSSFSRLGALARGRHLLAGGLCIALGLYIIYDGILMRYLSQFLWDRFPWIYQMLRSLPTLLVALCIIFVGIRLVRGDSLRAQEEDFTEYRGGASLPDDPECPEEGDPNYEP